MRRRWPDAVQTRRVYPSDLQPRLTHAPILVAMDDPELRLRRYQLTVAELWVGYAVAAAVVLLWSGANAAPWFLLVGIFFGTLGVASLVAFTLIERRPPWAIPWRTHGQRQPISRGYVASLVVFLLLGATTTTLIRLIGQSGALVVLLGVLLAWLTLSVRWRPARALVFPYLVDRSQGGDGETR